jgi:hypothetical protein
MMKRLCLVFLLFTASAVAQVSAPATGFVRDRAGSLRPVLGVAGSFVLGDPIEEAVISVGFGKSFGYAKTEAEILVLRSDAVVERHAAPAGSSLFYLGSDGEIEQIYFPSVRELWRVQGSGFKKMADTDIPQPPFEVRGDELTLRDGTTIRLPEPVGDPEWLSDNWIVVRGRGALYTVRIGSDARVMQLPQAAQ